MKTVQVVCIDQSDSSPSCTPERRTNAITRVGQIDELDALGGVDVDGLGDDGEAAGAGRGGLRDGRFPHGDHRALGHHSIVER